MKKLLKTLYKSLLGHEYLKNSGDFHGCPELSEAFPEVGLLNENDRTDLERILKVKIKNSALYEQAFIHRSYMHVLKVEKRFCLSNERLEFFGDAILEFVVSEYLFGLFIDEFEGGLSKMRANIVSGKSMAICCKELGLDKYLKVSYSAKKNLDGGSGESMISDLMEAVIGAVYLDNDLETVRNFIIELLLPIVMEKGLLKDTNYKSKFMETVQADGYSTPTYETLKEEGPPHSRYYEVGAFIEDKLQAKGSGRSKKEAEQNAAKIALNNYLKDCEKAKK